MFSLDSKKKQKHQKDVIPTFKFFLVNLLGTEYILYASAFFLFFEYKCLKGVHCPAFTTEWPAQAALCGPLCYFEGGRKSGGTGATAGR